MGQNSSRYNDRFDAIIARQNAGTYGRKKIKLVPKSVYKKLPKAAKVAISKAAKKVGRRKKSSRRYWLLWQHCIYIKFLLVCNLRMRQSSILLRKS